MVETLIGFVEKRTSKEVIRKIIWSCLMIYGAALFVCSATPRRVNRILWWNVENLFDCVDDSLVQDEEFLPESPRRWTKHRYYRKLWQIGQVISAMGDTSPVIIGLGEVEGDKPLRDLTQYTLKNLAPYLYICTHGHDKRGIQVAMLYDSRRLVLFDVQEVNISHDGFRTRNYLHASGVFMQKDTIDIYVCHWPSQWGGARASEPKRLLVSQRMQKDVLSTVGAHPSRDVLVLGDFNEESTSPALRQFIKHCNLVDCIVGEKRTDYGTHHYKGIWSVLDHILVSKSFYKNLQAGGVWKMDCLLEKDSRGCSKPYRTYLGPFYHGGFSDHLPVYIDVTN